MLIDNLHVLLESGLPTAFSSVDTTYSLLSESYVIMHRSVPGLSGVCQTLDGPVAVFFVDALPRPSEMGGHMMFTRRSRIVRDEPLREDHWLITLQQGSFAWQLMTDTKTAGKPLGMAMFLQWKPGCFASAMEAHHNLIRSFPSEHFDLNTDLERVGISTLMLSEGMSSIANTVLEQPWFKHALGTDLPVTVDHPFVTQALRVNVNWTINTDLLDA